MAFDPVLLGVRYVMSEIISDFLKFEFEIAPKIFTYYPVWTVQTILNIRAKVLKYLYFSLQAVLS